MRDGAEGGMGRCLCNVGWQYGCLEKQILLCGKCRGLKSVYTPCQNVNDFYLKSSPKVCKSKEYLPQVSDNQPQYLLSVSPSTRKLDIPLLPGSQLWFSAEWTSPPLSFSPAFLEKWCLFLFVGPSAWGIAALNLRGKCWKLFSDCLLWTLGDDWC